MMNCSWRLMHMQRGWRRRCCTGTPGGWKWWTWWSWGNAIKFECLRSALCGMA